MSADMLKGACLAIARVEDTNWIGFKTLLDGETESEYIYHIRAKVEPTSIFFVRFMIK